MRAHSSNRNWLKGILIGFLLMGLGSVILAVSEMAVIYLELLEDLKTFPVVKSQDPEILFVSYENTWGQDRTFGGDRRHEGCDLMGDRYEDGTYPVVSMTDGVVEKMGWLKLGGWRIGIRSANGIYYYYAHLDSYTEGLEEGSIVCAGQEIGRMGSTGYSTVEGTRGNFATHLHVGIYLPTKGGGEKSINPYYILQYLEKRHTMMEWYD